MASIQDNYAEIDSILAGLADSVNFTHQGHGKAIGQEALDVAAHGIADRTITAGQDIDGKPLAPLKPRYAKYKAAHGGDPGLIGVWSGDMLSHLQLAGEREIGPDEAVMTYGRPGPSRPRPGARLGAASPSNRDKAEWFTVGCDVDRRGRKQGRKPRPFYALDAKIRADVHAYFEGVLRLILSRIV